LTKKTKIANKEDDSLISDGQYGFKGNKKKKYGYDFTLDGDGYDDANVLEWENDDPRETVLDDDKKDSNKKSKTTNKNTKEEVKSGANVNPEVHDAKKLNQEDKNKEEEKQNGKDEVNPSAIESKNTDTAIQEDALREKEEQKDKSKEKEKQDHLEEKHKEDSTKEKHHHEEQKDKKANHDVGGINKPKAKEVKVPGQGNPTEQKDANDENAGSIEKIAINKDSTDGYVDSLNQVHPIQFIDEVKHSPTTGHQLEDKESKKEHAKLPEIEQPTGLPLKGSDKIDKTKDQSKPKDIKLQPEGPKKFSLIVDDKHEQPLAPLPLPQIPYVNKETGDATAIKNVLHTFPTSDPNLNSDFGPVPEINLDGQADPQQNEKFHTEALDQTNEEKAKADVEITKDYGENNVYPSIETEKLKTDYQFTEPVDISSIVHQDTSAFDEATKAKFDVNALNKLQEDREQEIQKVMDGKEQKDQKIEKEHRLHHEKIEKETLKVKKDQEKEQDLAKKSVDKHRQDWEAENQKVKSDFDTESDQKKKETQASIDDQVKKTDADIKTQVNDANKQVKDKTDEAERKAKAEKAKADEQPKGFWDSITDAVSDFFDAIKDAINSIFDALRKFVKTVIEKAKKAINDLIDFVRDAVIGMIKAFGEALKALVKIALAAFPELRDKFCAFIDKAVDTACDAVNKLAEGLKKAVNFLLDALGKVIDMVLAFYQKLVNLALTALQMLAVGLLKVLKFLSQIGEKLKKFGALIDAINDIYHHPEILEQAAQQTLQPYIDKIPAETAAKLNEGLSAVGLSKHFKGVWKYLGPALSHLASNWWGEAKKMVWYLIWPFAEGSPLYEDAPKLVSLVPQIWKDVWAGEYSKAIDGCLEWMQALNMTLGAFSGWMAIAGIVVGAVIGGVVGAVGGAGVGAIPGAVAGAGAGLELAAAVGEGLMVSMMATEAAVLTKAIYDLATTEDDENKESTPSAPATPPNENNSNSGNKPEGPQGGSEQPVKHFTSGTVKSGHDRIEYAYQRIANSVITLGIMGALLLLGAIGGKIAQGLASAFKKIGAALERVAPETMAGIRNAMSKVSSGAGKFTKPFKDFSEKYGGDFNKGRKWMEGKIDNVKGKFGIKNKGKGGKEEENNNNNHEENKDNQNNNENNNENNQNNKDENQNQNNNENNEQNQNKSEQKDEVDTNSKEENNSNKNEEEGNSENSNSEEKNEVDTNENNNEKVEEKPVEEKSVEEKTTEENEQTGKEKEKSSNKEEPNPLEEKEPKSEAKDNTPGPKEKPASEKTPEDLLDEALKRQGFKDGEGYPNGFKEKWSDGEYDYEVRIHEAEPQHGKSGNIYRVARRKKGVDANGQGFGWEYGDMNGNWHSTKSLKPGKGTQKNPDYNEQAAKDTHIEVPDKKIGETKNGPKDELKNTNESSNIGPKNEDPVNADNTPPKETPKEEGVNTNENKTSEHKSESDKVQAEKELKEKQAEERAKQTSKELDPSSNEHLSADTKQKAQEIFDSVPNDGSLDLKETRKWYLEQESKIPDLIDRNLSLEGQAREAFELRNSFRTKARSLMEDRQLAGKLMAEEPNMTWEQVLDKYRKQGFEGDNLYNKILESSQKSRKSVNQNLGLDKPEVKPEVKPEEVKTTDVSNTSDNTKTKLDEPPVSNGPAEGPIAKLPEPAKQSLEKLKGAGLQVVEEGNVVKILSKDGKVVAEIEDGVLKFKYDGYGGDIVMDPDKTTTVLGKFFEDIHDPDKGTRRFLGTDKEPLKVEGLPEGSFSRGEGKGSNNNGMNFLDIKEADYNALMDKNIQKYLDKGFPRDEAERLGRIDGNAEFWDTYNEPFLEESFKRGDNVRLVSDPATQRTGTYARELESIEKPGGLAEKYGYKYDEATNTWKKASPIDDSPKMVEPSTVEVNPADIKDTEVTGPKDTEANLLETDNKVPEDASKQNLEVPKEEVKPQLSDEVKSKLKENPVLEQALEDLPEFKKAFDESPNKGEFLDSVIDYIGKKADLKKYNPADAKLIKDLLKNPENMDLFKILYKTFEFKNEINFNDEVLVRDVEHLVDECYKEYVRIKSGGDTKVNPNYLSKTETGPVLSAVLDRSSGKIKFGYNNITDGVVGSKEVPTNLSELMDKNLKEYTSAGKKSGLDNTVLGKEKPGVHSETKALNEHLAENKDKPFDPNNYLIFNIWLDGPKKGTSAVRCPNCNVMTKGILSISDVPSEQLAKIKGYVERGKYMDEVKKSIKGK